ncbi:MAG TPA: outer membrane beta-barrel protein [candidate division Zixibacteria bacterium]|nr:outer membrane beta-barrel protein [candidate division Zixibacteria bacterium]
MKRLSLLFVLVGLYACTTVQAQKIAQVGDLGVGVSGGLMLPASGDIDTENSFGDYFDVGPVFGAHVNYLAMDYLTVQCGFDYTFMKMKDDMITRDEFDGEPYFVAPNIYLNGIWNMAPFFKSESNTVNPYLLAGGGLYFWKVTDDGAGGDALVINEAGDDFSKTSFGLQFGGGVEIYATPNISILVEGKYHMIFTEDKDTFGDDFGNLGVIGLKAGLTYHFPLGSN